MYIEYKYNKVEKLADLNNIINDIVIILSTASPSGLSAMYDTAGGVIKHDVDCGWTATLASNIITAKSGSDTYAKNVELSFSTPTYAISTSTASEVCCTIGIKSYYLDGTNKLVNYGHADANFVKPVLYKLGGVLLISATPNQLLIASLNSARSIWTPGIGVVDFMPYSVNNLTDPTLVDQTDSYYAAGTYPTWIYMSMNAGNGFTNMSIAKRFNVISQADMSSTTGDALNLLQIKSPYVDNIAKVTNLNIPARTMNMNLSSSIVCARFAFHNSYAKSVSPNDFYDIGGDVSTICPLFLISSGRSMDTIDVAMPNHNAIAGQSDPLYRSYYGSFAVWGTTKGTLSSSKANFIVRMG